MKLRFVVDVIDKIIYKPFLINCYLVIPLLAPGFPTRKVQKSLLVASDNEPKIWMIISILSLVNPVLPFLWGKSISSSVLSLEIKVHYDDQNGTSTCSTE
jgi:hypothetical protein